MPNIKCKSTGKWVEFCVHCLDEHIKELESENEELKKQLDFVTEEHNAQAIAAEEWATTQGESVLLKADNKRQKESLKQILEVCQDNVNHYDDVVYSDVHNEFKYLVDEVEKIL